MQGQEEERSRISLELHDTVAQNIKYAQLLVEQLKPHLPEDGGVRELSGRITDVDLRCIRDIRTLCCNLTPPDLAAALSHFCTTFSLDSGIPCTIVVAEGTPLDILDARQKLHCFRLVQEALNNKF
jgi:signal transduction histidine kinase